MRSMRASFVVRTPVPYVSHPPNWQRKMSIIKTAFTQYASPMHWKSQFQVISTSQKPQETPSGIEHERIHVAFALEFLPKRRLTVLWSRSFALSNEQWTVNVLIFIFCNSRVVSLNRNRLIFKPESLDMAICANWFMLRETTPRWTRSVESTRLQMLDWWRRPYR